MDRAARGMDSVVSASHRMRTPVMLSHFLRKLASLSTVKSPSEVVTVRAGGMVWTIPTGRAEMFGTGPDLAEWQSSGHSTPVKQNHQRTITRVQLPSATVFVKLCRANTPRAWARELLRPAKARLEFENAIALRTLHIATIEPLAWGGTPGPLPGDSVLITRNQDGAEPFATFLTETLPTLPPHVQRGVSRQLARGLALFLAKMHEAGVSHPDPHPGNLLIELPPSRIPKFFLIDLHAVRFGRPLTWTETRENLTLLNRWFQLRCSRADRVRFWRAYLMARSTLNPDEVDAARMAKELELATDASNGRFWANRTDRYRTNNREFQRIRGVGVSGYAVRDLPNDVLQPWLANPDAMFTKPGISVLKDSRSSTVVRFTIPTANGPRAVIGKRFLMKSPGDALKNLLRSSEALRSWLNGHGLRDRDVPTARPLAMFHRRLHGLPAEGYIVFEEVPDASGLPEAVANLDATDRVPILRTWAERIGRLLRVMHDREVSHRDLKGPNLLLSGVSDPFHATPVVIDLVGVRAGHAVPRAIRVRDLARLAASFHDSPLLSRTDRLRVLRAYLRWGLHGSANWKSWWNEIDAAIRVKVAKNERTGRPLGCRRR